MWQGTVGLINGQHKYLTAESFGHKINANGITMKKKQQWSVELFPLTDGASADELSEVDFVAIKSHLNCYLAVDSYGNVTCDSLEKTEECRFIITICSMSSGGNSEQIYWAFKNVVRNYYLGASSDGMINCNAKMPQSRAELWHVHLQPARGAANFALRSIGRKRFARCAPLEQGSQVKVDANIPWTERTLFQFRYVNAGLYSLLTSDGQLLSADGICLPPLAADVQPPSNTLFNIEFHSGFVALRDQRGQYLAGTGHASILKTRSSSVSKDELFELHPAPLQVSMRAAFNGKWLSVKQGVDVTANQDEVSEEHETFQLLYLPEEHAWLVQTKAGDYWTAVGASVAANSTDAQTHFQLHWNEEGSCSWKVLDGKSARWICNRKSGQLSVGTPSGDKLVDPVAFHMRLCNRTALYLRSMTGTGFVGLRTPVGGKLEANKSSPDAVKPVYEPSLAGANGCLLKMGNVERYWTVGEGNIVKADATTPACAQTWVLELRTAIAMAIRTADTGLFLCTSAQGTLQLNACEPGKATLWEF